jgi:uncharacterized integral membrane protein
LTGASPSAGAVLRKIAAALVLVPLAIVIIAFAVANRQLVTLSLDPFSADRPAAAVTLPLFALIIVLLILGVVVGGVAAWLRQSQWRRKARRLERELTELRAEVSSLRRAGGSVDAPRAVEPPERVQLKLPVR